MSDIMKKVTFLLRRGLKKDLPNLLEGEMGLATDTEELYVGTSDGRMQLAKQDDLQDAQDKIGILQEGIVQPSGVSMTNTLGIQVHDSGYKSISVNYDKIKEYGFNYVRGALVWAEIEKTQGVYSFVNDTIDCDAFINNILSRGMKPLITLLFSNSLYSNHTALDTDAHKQAFANWAGACAARYKNKGIIWEVHNEPNGEWFWEPQTDSAIHYADLFKRSIAAIKQNDPSATVIGPSLSGPEVFTNLSNYEDSLPWLETTFKSGLLDYVDALAIHPYRDVEPETVLNSYKEMNNLIKKYTDRNVPVIVSEWGYSSVPNWNGSGSSAIASSELEQAQYLVRQFLLNQSQNIPVTIYYDWKDDGQDSTLVEHYFGINKFDPNTPKQAGEAFKVLAKQLKDFYFVESIFIGKDDYLFKYTDNSYRTAYVYWTTGVSHTFNLLESVNGKIVSMFGTETPVSGENVTLTLTQSPSYLISETKQKIKVETPTLSDMKVQKAIDYLLSHVANLGLGKSPYNLDNIDQNTIISNGFYRATNSTLNKFSPMYWGSVIVAGNDASGEVSQIGVNSYDNSMYYRSCQVVNGVRTWLPPERVVKVSELKSLTFTQPTLTAPITNITGQEVAYGKNYLNEVRFKGSFNPQGSGVLGRTLFTLPVGYRPASYMSFAVAGGIVSVSADGVVKVEEATSATFVGINNVSFIAEQ